MRQSIRLVCSATGVAVLALGVACSPQSFVDVPPPSTVVDPSVVTTASGAMDLYNAAVTRFASMLGGYFAATSLVGTDDFLDTVGHFTDELMRVQGVPGNTNVSTDERLFTVTNTFGIQSIYGGLHSARVQAQQGREALRLYAPNAPPAWLGRLYALEGHSVLWFAELFCSGVPLPAVPLLHAPAPSVGYSTPDMFTHAIALFDSAITFGADTARFVNLAKVGKGRALLGLGRFSDAAAAVSDVPTDFIYNAELNTATFPNVIGNHPQYMQVVDHEGGNGFVWSTDPRTATVTTPTISGAMLVSAKYSVTASGTLDATVAAPNTPVRAADGLEARLIEAEAALSAGSASWLTILNTLRATCIGTAKCAPVPGLTAASLPPLTDPGTVNARLNLLMQERAMWLYLTGHREGDLRRLAHVYNRDPNTLWPTGTYINPGFPPLIQTASDNGTAYGNDLVIKLPDAEITNNPLAHQGCFDMNP